MPVPAVEVKLGRAVRVPSVTMSELSIRAILSS